MEKWISEKKAQELLKIDKKMLLELEKNGKVRTIFLMGNKKLYLLSNLEEIPKTTTKPKGLLDKLFSWLGFKRG